MARRVAHRREAAVASMLPQRCHAAATLLQSCRHAAAAPPTRSRNTDAGSRRARQCAIMAARNRPHGRRAHGAPVDETTKPTRMIHLHRVSRTFRDGEREIHALQELTLSVPAGSSLALMGRSGSGKSTLLHLIGGLEWPSAGRVEVDGQALAALDDAALTRFRLHRIGFVFQFFHLLPALSVLENLLLPAELAARPAAAARSKALALLEAVGLGERRHTYPERLSGGEQQRVAVARALMLDPPVLLADEPTGNLDSENGARVLELMWGLAASRGTTVVVATHSREVAARAARRIELLDGRIVADSAAAAGVPPPGACSPGDSPAGAGATGPGPSAP
jgi:putative ABC transport system ATP-binding protein